MTGPAAISGADVAALLDYPSLTDRLDAAFRQACEAPLRHRHDLPGGGMMLIKPAWRADGPVAVKIVNVFPDNATRNLPAVQGTVLMFDGATGAPLAVIDGQSLTNRRTAAASALASRYLSRADASVHLIVGTGQLAPEFARAHAAVRPITETLVWGRSADKAESVAAHLRAGGMAARSVDDLEAAVRRADIITGVTLSTEPLVRGEWLSDGVHLDLVGSYRPDMRESDDAAVAACRVYVDTFEGALAEAGDLVQPIEKGVLSRDDILGELAGLCAGAVPGRTADNQKTLFKSVGTALEDLAAAELVWERAAK